MASRDTSTHTSALDTGMLSGPWFSVTLGLGSFPGVLSNVRTWQLSWTMVLSNVRTGSFPGPWFSVTLGLGSFPGPWFSVTLGLGSFPGPWFSVTLGLGSFGVLSLRSLSLHVRKVGNASQSTMFGTLYLFKHLNHGTAL